MIPLLMLSVRQLAGRWRLALILLLAALPVVVIVLVRIAGGDQDSDWHEAHTNGFIDAMLIAAIMPIVMMALATAAFGHELEDRTLSYLVLKPVARSYVVLPKMLAPIIVGAPLLIVSGVLTMLIGTDAGLKAAVAVGVALLAGIAGYAAIFTWAGLVTRSAIFFALVYVMMWEGVLSSLLSGVRYLSVRGYTLAIMHGIDNDSFDLLADRVIEFPAAVGGAILVTVAFFLLTLYRLRRMDVP